MSLEEIQRMLERHEQKIKTLERDKWRSENENVVIVNETSGKITAVSEGSTIEIDSNFSGEI